MWPKSKKDIAPADAQIAPPQARVKTESELQQQALRKALEEQRKVDPLVGAKLGGKELSHRLMQALKTERGVHIESLLCALGALAGYACQASLRAQALAQELPETAALVVVKTNDGRRFFFGDPLNRLLAESQHSVWSLVAGEAQHQGCKALPDVAAIFQHVSQTIGGDAFGVPRIPEGHLPGQLPARYLQHFWPGALGLAQHFCAAPHEWPVLFGLAIQDVMQQAKGVIAPELALTIVMECAVPMSKIEMSFA